MLSENPGKGWEWKRKFEYEKGLKIKCLPVTLGMRKFPLGGNRPFKK